MRCDRCGRENPDQLTFCEDCGYALGRARRDAAVPSQPGGTRPAAPDFGLLAPRAAAAPAGWTCGACRTRNDPGHRFCITCGATHDAQASVAATQLASTAPETGSPNFLAAQRPPTVPDGAAAAAIAASRVGEPSGAPLAAVRMVPIGGPTPIPTPAVDGCPRCRTPAPTGALYCRVCGYSLAEPTTHREPAPAPINLGSTARLDPREIPAPSAPNVLAAPPPSLRAAPTPLAVPRAAGRLVLLDKDGSDRTAFLLTGEALDVGARDGAVLLDDDPFLSPRHARIARDPARSEWHVIDLESVNGVYVKLRGRWSLADGDLILLGQQVLRFDTVKDAEHGLGPATQHGTALFGTPPMPRLARLCQRTVEGVTRDVFHIHRAETSLGRETADIVFTDDPFLSRRHAVLTHDATTRSFQLEDAGSSNGTFVAIRGRAPLSDGDILRMGLHVFRIELQAAAASTDPSARS